MGPAQLAYRKSDHQDALDYVKVKAAILDQTGISPETYQQWSRCERYPTGARLRAVAQCLRAYAWRWLEPNKGSGAQVAEAVTLEQFTQVLLAGGKEWVQ